MHSTLENDFLEYLLYFMCFIYHILNETRITRIVQGKTDGISFYIEFKCLKYALFHKVIRKTLFTVSVKF